LKSDFAGYEDDSVLKPPPANRSSEGDEPTCRYIMQEHCEKTETPDRAGLETLHMERAEAKRKEE
jgi:hypothetical protein